MGSLVTLVVARTLDYRKCGQALTIGQAAHGRKRLVPCVTRAGLQASRGRAKMIHHLPIPAALKSSGQACRWRRSPRSHGNFRTDARDRSR